MSINQFNLSPSFDKNLLNSFSVLKNNILNNINCVQTGTIQTFNNSNQTCTVTINTKRQVTLNPVTWQDYSILVDVPVLIPGGGGGSLQFPISQGDECILLFNDRELDAWFANGKTQPFDEARTHSLSDAIAIVGLHSLPNSLQNYVTNAVNLSYNGISVNLSNLGVTINSDLTVTGDLVVQGTTIVNGGTW